MATKNEFESVHDDAVEATKKVREEEIRYQEEAQRADEASQKEKKERTKTMDDLQEEARETADRDDLQKRWAQEKYGTSGILYEGTGAGKREQDHDHDRDEKKAAPSNKR